MHFQFLSVSGNLTFMSDNNLWLVSAGCFTLSSAALIHMPLSNFLIGRQITAKTNLA